MVNSYPEIYKNVLGRNIDVSNILVDFNNLPIPDPKNSISAASAADRFFEKYGMGNIVGIIHRPYERMYGYELLLKLLYDHDKNRFQLVHKGTPYYFTGWTALQVENYEKGIFYLDQAVSEDLRKTPDRDISSLKRNPAVGFLLLDPQPQSGIALALELLHGVEDEIGDFGNVSSQPFNKTDFVDKFILNGYNFFDNGFRTIVTSLYSFILEYQRLQTQLEIRSYAGGSLEPFFLHLFKGGLILESLLKQKNPGTEKTLGPILRDYYVNGNNLQMGDPSKILHDASLDEVVAHLAELKKGGESYQNICLATTYGIRNTTGHNLTWNDIFKDGGVAYESIYKSVLGSIFWTIYKLWVE